MDCDVYYMELLPLNKRNSSANGFDFLPEIITTL